MNYLKRIIISYEGVFTYAAFLKMATVSMTRQGALKILNRFAKLGFLKEVPSSSKVKLFDIDRSSIPFALSYDRHR